MRILIAADSFKDALNAQAVCDAIARGVRKAVPHAEIDICPVADGGEGTADVLAGALNLQSVEMDACDPLRRPMRARYLMDDARMTAFVELARTAGLQLLSPADRNPLLTSTRGVGLQIAHAVRNGARRLILAIGGSATNDAGVGMAAALGWRFMGADGLIHEPIGQSLGQLRQIAPPVQANDFATEVICDVTNPLFGRNGAAYVYARQKGADDAAIALLDAGLRNLSDLAQAAGFHCDPDAPGSGAAGGMGFGARLFLNATLRRGIDLMLDLLQFDQKAAQADFVLTGEGKIDAQTAQGKAVQGICKRAAVFGAPVLGFCGRLELDEPAIKKIGLQAAYDINAPYERRLPLEALLQKTAERLEETTYRVLSTLQTG